MIFQRKFEIFGIFKLIEVIKLDQKGPRERHPYYNALPISKEIEELWAHLLRILILLSKWLYIQHVFYEGYSFVFNYQNYAVFILAMIKN